MLNPEYTKDLRSRLAAACQQAAGRLHAVVDEFGSPDNGMALEKLREVISNENLTELRVGDLASIAQYLVGLRTAIESMVSNHYEKLVFELIDIGDEVSTIDWSTLPQGTNGVDSLDLALAGELRQGLSFSEEARVVGKYTRDPKIAQKLVERAYATMGVKDIQHTAGRFMDTFARCLSEGFGA